MSYVALGEQHVVAATPGSALSPHSPATSSVIQEGRHNPFHFRGKTKRVRTSTVPVVGLIAMSEKKKRPSMKVLTKKTHSSDDLQRMKLQAEDVIEEDSVDGRKVEIRDEVETVCFSLTYLRKDGQGGCSFGDCWLSIVFFLGLVLSASPCLWVGLSSGYAICVVLQIPPSDRRVTEPVSSLPTGAQCVFTCTRAEVLKGMFVSCRVCVPFEVSSHPHCNVHCSIE